VSAEWREVGGVLLLGYEMYRLLTTKQVLVKPRRPGRRMAHEPEVINVDELEFNRELRKGSCCPNCMVSLGVEFLFFHRYIPSPVLFHLGCFLLTGNLKHIVYSYY